MHVIIRLCTPGISILFAPDLILILILHLLEILDVIQVMLDSFSGRFRNNLQISLSSPLISGLLQITSADIISKN